MELKKLRDELLSQHAELRTVAEEVAKAATKVDTDPSEIPALHALLARFDTQIRAHNAYEERELHAVLPTLDAWGAIRDQLMDHRHVEEHKAIVNAVKIAESSADPTAITAAVRTLLHELADHMEREEREFLHHRVLKDDLITSGTGG